MPINPRIRGNNVFGVTTDNPLMTAASSFNSLGLVNLPSVIIQHAIITLDPLRQFGNPEIVIVTVHTAFATIATITRGAYGTTPRSHPVGTLWVHAPLNEDFIAVTTSLLRPTDPYKGQLIFETDTNKLVGFGGADWAPRDAGGQLGYAQVITPQTLISAEVDITGLTATVTVGTGRRVRIYAEVGAQRTVADGLNRLRIKEGATTLLLRDTFVRAALEGSIIHSASIILSPSAGSHTYKLSYERVTGSGTVNADAATTAPAYVLVEDIGAN